MPLGAIPGWPRPSQAFLTDRNNLCPIHKKPFELRSIGNHPIHINQKGRNLN
jgi:hypothetical protein